MLSAAALAVLAVLVVAACSGSADDSDRDGGVTSTGGDGGADGQRFPDVIDVEIERTGDDTYELAVTLSSPYDSPERYADGWRVTGDDGTVYGTHELTHDHAGEQPFTRTQSGVHIPGGVDEVVVEGHDLANGYGGQTMTVPLPGG
jgi:hypothetical protein